jgi:hypothetical protein
MSLVEVDYDIQVYMSLYNTPRRTRLLVSRFMGKLYKNGTGRDRLLPAKAAVVYASIKPVSPHFMFYKHIRDGIRKFRRPASSQRPEISTQELSAQIRCRGIKGRWVRSSRERGILHISPVHRRIYTESGALFTRHRKRPTGNEKPPSPKSPYSLALINLNIRILAEGGVSCFPRNHGQTKPAKSTLFLSLLVSVWFPFPSLSFPDSMCENSRQKRSVFGKEKRQGLFQKIQ